MTAYVDADAVIDAMPVSIRPDPDSEDPTDVAKVARITSLCTSTAEMIDAELKVDFHRHPATGSDPAVARIFDGHGSSILHVHAGIISVTTVEVRWSQASDWDALEADDWELVSMFEAEDPTRPYDHILFTRRLPPIKRGVRVSGHHGWATAPTRLAELNVAWIRQHLAAGDSYSGAAQLPDGSIPTPRLVLPDDVRMFFHVESRRYETCWT